MASVNTVPKTLNGKTAWEVRSPDGKLLGVFYDRTSLQIFMEAIEGLTGSQMADVHRQMAA